MIALSNTTKVILTAAFMSALLGACRKTPNEQSNTPQSGATTTAPSGTTGGTGTEGSGTSGTSGATGTGGTTTPTPPTPAPGTTPETPAPAPGNSPRPGTTGS